MDLSLGTFATQALSKGWLAKSMRLIRSHGWPIRPVRLILAPPPGSGADAIVRLIAEQLARQWGQSVVVENRPGVQRGVGAEEVAGAAPDGYTYLAIGNSLVTNEVYRSEQLPYRADFVPVGMMGTAPFAVSVPASSPFASLGDLVRFAKAHPDQLTMASDGARSVSGLLARMLAAHLGISVRMVIATVADAAQGRADVLLSSVPSATPLAAAGRLRPLAVTTARRVVNQLWHVPAVSELLPGFDYAGWIGILAPAGTPAAVVQRFNRDLDAVLKDEELAAGLQAIGFETQGAGTPGQMVTFLAAEHARWVQLKAMLGIPPMQD